MSLIETQNPGVVADLQPKGGVRSGASQPHKHIQFIPLDDDAPIDKLAQSINLETPGTASSDT